MPRKVKEESLSKRKRMKRKKERIIKERVSKSVLLRLQCQLHNVFYETTRHRLTSLALF